jgi:hypothetical protein
MENNLMRWHYSFGGDALSSWGQVFLEAIRKEETDQAVGVGFGGNGQPSGENWQAYQINGVWYFDISEEADHYNTDKLQSFVVKGVHDVTGENCCEQESLTTNIVTEQVFSIVIEWLGWKGGCTKVSNHRIHKVTSEWADLMVGSSQFEMEFT